MDEMKDIFNVEENPLRSGRRRRRSGGGGEEEEEERSFCSQLQAIRNSPLD